MPKFRKKPVVVEAEQWDGTELNALAVIKWSGHKKMFYCTGPGDLQEIEIETLEGTMTASKGDWIIRGVKGEIYPCKPDIFEETYDPVRLTGEQSDG